MSNKSKFVYIAYPEATQSIASICSLNVKGVEKEPWDLNDEEQTRKCTARFNDNAPDALIIIINDDFVKSHKFVELVTMALDKRVKVISASLFGSKYPEKETIASLPEEHQEIIRHKIVYAGEYCSNWWNKILDRLNWEDRINRWVVRSVGKEAEEIAKDLNIYGNIPESPKEANICFILTHDALNNDEFLEDLERVYLMGTPFVVVRPSTLSTENTPYEKKFVKHLLTGPNVIIYYPQFKEYYADILESIPAYRDEKMDRLHYTSLNS